MPRTQNCVLSSKCCCVARIGVTRSWCGFNQCVHNAAFPSSRSRHARSQAKRHQVESEMREGYGWAAGGGVRLEPRAWGAGDEGAWERPGTGLWGSQMECSDEERTNLVRHLRWMTWLTRKHLTVHSHETFTVTLTGQAPMQKRQK